MEKTGITADVCSARDDAAPDMAVSGLRSLERAAASVREELAKSRCVCVLWVSVCCVDGCMKREGSKKHQTNGLTRLVVCEFV